MLLLVGEVGTVHEQELGPVQADAVGHHLPHRDRVLGQFDVGVQADQHPVAGHRRLAFELVQFALLAALLLLLVTVIAQNAFVQTDQDDALAAIHDHRLVVAQIGASVARAHHRRNPQAARQNGGVRQRAAILGDKRQHALMLHQDGIRRGQVIGHHDPSFQPGSHQLGIDGIVEIGRVLGQQNPLDPPHDVVNILLAGAQVGIVHVIEHLRQRIALDFQRPFGIAVVGADQPYRRLGEGGVLQHQQMGVDEGGDIARRRGWNSHPDIPQLLPGYGQAIQEPLDFILDDGVRDGELGDFRLVAFQQIGPADRIPPGNPDAMERKRHG